MKLRVTILILLCICAWTTIAFSAQNPFIRKKTSPVIKKQGIQYPRFFQPILTKIAQWQRVLKQNLTRFGKEIKEQPYGKAFWLFLLFAFIYGSVHALGPGHGKSIVVSYFLSRPGKYVHGVLMSNILTFVHAFSAVTIILIARIVFDATGLTLFETASQHLEKISYSLLIVLGIFLFGKFFHEWKNGHFKISEQETPQATNVKHLILTALVTGLVPCPGAALIFIFALSQHIVFAGLLAMICVAAGMGLTTTLFALFAITSRNTMFHLTTRRQILFTLSHAVLSLGGAFIITFLGTLLLLS